MNEENQYIEIGTHRIYFKGIEFNPNEERARDETGFMRAVMYFTLSQEEMKHALSQAYSLGIKDYIKGQING